MQGQKHAQKFRKGNVIVVPWPNQGGYISHSPLSALQQWLITNGLDKMREESKARTCLTNESRYNGVSRYNGHFFMWFQKMNFVVTKNELQAEF